jgi:hypothetical protein
MLGTQKRINKLLYQHNQTKKNVKFTNKSYILKQKHYLSYHNKAKSYNLLYKSLKNYRN